MKFTIEMSPEEAKELFIINNEKLFEVQKKLMEQMITKAVEQMMLPPENKTIVGNPWVSIEKNPMWYSIYSSPSKD